MGGGADRCARGGGRHLSQISRRPALLRLRTLALAAAALGTAVQPQPLRASEHAPAAAPAEDVDQDLLEFLGSVDSQTDDSSWFEFLRTTDIGKLAKEKSKPAAPKEKKR